MQSQRLSSPNLTITDQKANDHDYNRATLMNLNLNTEFTTQEDGSCVLKLIGNVESRNHHLMWFFDSSEALLQNVAAVGAQKLVVDLTTADRIDSEGLRRLLYAQQDFAKQNIQVVLRNPNPHLRRLLRIMQFDLVFPIEMEPDS
jgi:anti-anti-sigma factor